MQHNTIGSRNQLRWDRSMKIIYMGIAVYTHSGVYRLLFVYILLPNTWFRNSHSVFTDRKALWCGILFVFTAIPWSGKSYSTWFLMNAHNYNRHCFSAFIKYKDYRKFMILNLTILSIIYNIN